MLSLDELKQKKVEAKRKKYEADEMDAYLEVVYSNYNEALEAKDKLEVERIELNKNIKKLSDGIQYYRSIESTLQKALVLAEKTSKETKDAAIQKAAQIEKSANDNAKAVLEDANTKAETLLRDADIKANAAIDEANLKSEEVLNETKQKSEAILSDTKVKYDELKAKCQELVDIYEKYKASINVALDAHKELVNSEKFDIKAPEEFDATVDFNSNINIEPVKTATIDTSSLKVDPSLSKTLETVSATEMTDEQLASVELENKILNADTIDLTTTLEETSKVIEESEKSNSAPEVASVEPKVEPKVEAAPVEEDKPSEEPKQVSEETIRVPSISELKEQMAANNKADVAEKVNAVKENVAEKAMTAKEAVAEKASEVKEAAVDKLSQVKEAVSDESKASSQPAEVRDDSTTDKAGNSMLGNTTGSIPTLDSLLKDLNENNKGGNNSDDPFEFLGSVDDF
ncbi:DivIVA domain-containing protein [Eubacterium xylanophilum]|uniref:DivIVA domain-containing protein n=1 Tax=Eubacterium xylanophilum TaxID=39497 RepID=UPI00047AEB80|nr:DivIVA domain-containing protein [Eubacterium xylanophilum]